MSPPSRLFTTLTYDYVFRIGGLTSHLVRSREDKATATKLSITRPTSDPSITFVEFVHTVGKMGSGTLGNTNLVQTDTVNRTEYLRDSLRYPPEALFCTEPERPIVVREVERELFVYGIQD